MTELVLASASPRRRELITLLGLSFRVVTANVDEATVTDPDPAVNVVQTALLKGRDVAQMQPAGVVVVAADTTVTIEGQMLGKPVDVAMAAAMLRRLRGRTHHVYTGIALHRTGTKRWLTDVAQMAVPMRDYSDEELHAYIATGDPFDKAGAYAIQHPDFKPVTAFSDCYAGVVGLPLCHLTRALASLGVTVPGAVAAACQSRYQYKCPIYEQILLS